jgi:23S rRNA (guanosine2251-2'-O)-methyltransferase
MYVYGKNVANEIINDRSKVKRAFLIKNFSDKGIISALNRNNVKIKYLDKLSMDKMVDGNHQGIIFDVVDYEYFDIDELISEEDDIIVILDHLEDPHNFGAIIRTCEAAGVSGIVIPKDRSVSINSTVMKVSTGALDRVKVSQVTNLGQCIDYLKKKGFWVVGTDMGGTDYRKIDYSGKVCIVIGNEGNGMGDLVSKKCDFIASIPMKGSINSLNASVAAGIVIFEALKVR